MVQPTDQENEVSKRFVLSLKLIRSTGKETSSNQVATFKLVGHTIEYGLQNCPFSRSLLFLDLSVVVTCYS